MIEGFAIGLDAIVALEATRAKGFQMGLSKLGVHVAVAVRTGEGNTIRFGLMAL